MEKEFKRMRYFDGLTLKEEDYKLDKQQHRRLQRLHNCYMHTWGIAEGLEVRAVTDSSMEVYVTEGVALDRVSRDPETGMDESISREILIYTGHPDNPIDLSEYSAGENIYITVSYEDVFADRDMERGQGEEIHTWERGRISHDRVKPQDCKKNILLARIVPREATEEERKVRQDADAIIDSTCIFDTDTDGNPLRVYAGPYARALGLEKFIFKLGQEINKMPFLTAFDKTETEMELEVNSPSTKFTASMEIKGDLELNGELVWKSPGDVNLDFKVEGSVLQVNSPGNDNWKIRDGGLEVYRGGPGAAPDARIVWSEMERVWKLGTGNDLYAIVGGELWERLIKQELCDDLDHKKYLHQHQGLYSSKGSALRFDDSGELSVNVDLAVNGFDIKWEAGENPAGISWFGGKKLFKGTQVEGPVLYGSSRGLLGVTSNGQRPVLSWKSSGNVGIGSLYPGEDMLEVDGSVRMLGGTNPVKFTTAWTGFPDATINQAEISNDTANYRTLMIVGNQSAGQGRKVAVWDRLDVNGFLYTNGNMQISQALVPSAGSANNGILFPFDPGGGSSDRAWLKYYPRLGESCTLEIGTSNDGDDNISLMSPGNVGIGMLTPGEKLDVSGWTRVMSGTNPIRFTSNWSGFPDVAANQAEMGNDTGTYKTLMIVGNKSGGQGRKVSIWDRLEVNGSLQVNGNLRVDGAIVPGAGNSETKGIMFPKDPCGGSGDAAWIRYYSDPRRGGKENMTLEIGIANDSNLELVREKYWKSYCSSCSSPTNNRYGCGRWQYVERWVQGTTGDRLRLFASGGVYVDGGFYYSSSREYKENISRLCRISARDALEELEPVEFNFKGDLGRRTLGFIAESVPDIFSAQDKKAINPMEIITALVSEVKEQEEALVQLKKQVAALKR